MNCSKCGSPISEGEKFCQNCGEMVVLTKSNNSENDNSSSTQFDNNVNEKTNNFDKVVGISIGKIIVGIISFINSFIVGGMTTGYYSSKNSYGGDAYTGIQQASAQTANNVQYLAEVCKKGFAAILLVFGLALILIGIEEYLRSKNK